MSAFIGIDLESFSAAPDMPTPSAEWPGWPRALRGRPYRGELAEGAGCERADPYAETARRRALDARGPPSPGFSAASDNPANY